MSTANGDGGVPAGRVADNGAAGPKKARQRKQMPDAAAVEIQAVSGEQQGRTRAKRKGTASAETSQAAQPAQSEAVVVAVAGSEEAPKARRQRKRQAATEESAEALAQPAARAGDQEVTATSGEIEQANPTAGGDAPTPGEAPPRRGRGRPKGSKNTRSAGSTGAATSQGPAARLESSAAAQNEQAAALTAAAPGVSEAPVLPDDQTFQQLARLWPELHPQARRALVIHAAMLRAEL